MTFNQSLSDNRLVDLVIEGSDRAFSELYDRHISMVYNKCLSFTKIRNDAEDLAQDIMVKMHAYLPSYSKDNFPAWLMRITYNACVDHYRKNSKNKSVELTDIMVRAEEDPYDVSDDQLFEVRVNRLEQILEHLDPLDRAIILLKYRDDYKVYEIGELIGLKNSAVKMRLSRTKKKIIELNLNLKKDEYKESL